MLPHPSLEQQRVQILLENNNVIVDSVAGSGKTTTILQISQKFIDKSILLITYNAKLKAETREKIIFYKIKNLEAHTYHSFGYKYYSEKCTNDTELKKILEKNVTVVKKFDYDIIVIDEAQDMTPLFCNFVKKICEQNYRLYKMCIIGDKYQNIYSYKGSDSRYLTLSDKIFTNCAPWEKTRLSTTYRCTRQMADFINNAVLKQERIFSKKEGELPCYIICNTFSDYEDIIVEIKTFLKKGNNYDDIIVISRSIPSSLNSPIKCFLNKLSEDCKFPIHFSQCQSEDKEELCKDKIQFRNFHQVKGLEKKMVIVFGFDNSIFEYYDKDRNPKYCTNELYVALTRATEKLILVQHNKNSKLEFLSYEDINKYCNIIGNYIPTTSKVNFKDKTYLVYQLLDKIPEDVENECVNLITIKKIQEKCHDIKITNIYEQKYGKEDVSSINGIAFPCFFEKIIKGTVKSFNLNNFSRDFLIDLKLDLNFDELESISYYEELNKIENIPKDWIFKFLKNCNIVNSLYSKTIHKFNQINDYGWLDNKSFEESFFFLKKHVSHNSEFEKILGLKINGIEIKGMIDCIDYNNKTLFEFKCVTKIQNVHFLQLALYNHLHNEFLQSINENSFENTLIGDEIIYKHKKGNRKGIIRLIKNQNNIIKYEIKYKKRYTNIISIDDIIVNESLRNRKWKYILINILTGEIYEIISTFENLEKMLNILISVKKGNGRSEESNEDFINNNKFF